MRFYLCLLYNQAIWPIILFIFLIILHELSSSNSLYESILTALTSIPIDFNCASKEEYILKCLKLPEGTLRNKIALLKHKINKADITNDIAYKLLFDSKLEAQVYGYTTETSLEGSIKTTKGASRRNTKTQSPSYSESEAGGGLKSLETFDSYPNMSTMDLLNYLNDKDSIKEYNIQRLMQYGYLPVGGYENINVDYSKLSTDSAKIGETIPGITKEMTGPQIYQGVPEDYLTSDIQSKYNSYDVQTGYMSSKDNNPLNRTNKLYTQEANSLILMLKALSPDMDGKFNKYTVLDNLSFKLSAVFSIEAVATLIL